MNKLNRRNFLKGLTLSGLGLGLFRFKSEENEVIELPEIIELEMVAQSSGYQRYLENIELSTVGYITYTGNSGQVTYIGSNDSNTFITISSKVDA